MKKNNWTRWQCLQFALTFLRFSLPQFIFKDHVCQNLNILVTWLVHFKGLMGRTVPILNTFVHSLIQIPQHFCHKPSLNQFPEGQGWRPLHVANMRYITRGNRIATRNLGNISLSCTFCVFPWCLKAFWKKKTCTWPQLLYVCFNL